MRRAIDFERPVPEREMPSDRYRRAYEDICMVDLGEFFAGQVLIASEYFRQGLPGTGPRCYVRRPVAEMLARALECLPGGLTFKIYDAYRNIETQRALYDRYRQDFIFGQPDRGGAARFFRSFSQPSRDPRHPPAHNTGGAVDLTLYDIYKHEELPMGTAFDDLSEKAATAYFESHAGTDADIAVRDARRVLYWAMTEAGFANLPVEWWHYDYGDGIWSFYAKKPAIFMGRAATIL